MKKSKWRFVWVVPVAMLMVSAIPKITGAEMMVDNMQAAGMGHMTFWLGIIELSCVAIFLFPRTRKIGFLLLSAYVGGIIAAEWMSPTQTPSTGIIIQTLLWIGVYFEFPDMFGLSAKRKPVSHSEVAA